MMATEKQTADVPVQKSIQVNASAEHAFRVFTEDFDSWWPRGHHIGNAPLKKAVIEAAAGGRCYNEQTDGTECDWGTVLVWDPPRRLVIAWQINPSWKYEPDVAKSSEVEVRFTPEPGGMTRVDLEHRYFHRHGTGPEVEAMRTAVGSPDGWMGLLRLFAARAEETK